MTSIDDLLQHAPGTWEGTYQLWFDPAGEPQTTSPTGATVSLELDGNGLLLRYDWSFGDDAHTGLAVLSRAGDGLQMGWSDTFHYSAGVMHCAAGGGSATSMLGSYEAAGATWGWRTQVDMAGPDELTITAWNVTPDGEEGIATRASYRRVAS